MPLFDDPARPRNGTVGEKGTIATPVAPAAASASNTGVVPLALWAGTIFLSAFLLFAVQPILGKLILPWFGGAAAVWTTSLMFFQFAYLLGNIYAWWLSQRGPTYQMRVHI